MKEYDADPIIAVRSASFSYRPEQPVLSSIDATVNAGELLCLVGPNGGGKTTLLRGMAGLLSPRQGTVELAGTVLSPTARPLPLYGRGSIDRRRRARRIAVVLTNTVAPGYLRVHELIALGRIPYEGMRRVSDESLARVSGYVGITGLLDRRMSELSDGERQRAMVARALAQEPRVLLLDEPAVHLDPPRQTDLFRLLRALLAEKVVDSVAIATHLLHLALHMSDRILLVAHHTVESHSSADVVDSGRLEAAFSRASDTVVFDPERGWFVTRNE